MAWVARVNHMSFVEPAVLGPTTDDTEIPPTGLQPSCRYTFIIFSSFSKALLFWLFSSPTDATRKEAIQDITEYIEVFYNRQRKQAKLGFLSPAAFERWFYEKRLAA
jgi:transposase InsO family protein